MAVGKSWQIAVPIQKEGGTWGYITVYFQEEYALSANTSTLKVTKITGSNSIRAGTFYSVGSICVDGAVWYSWDGGDWAFGSNNAGFTAEFISYNGSQYPTGKVISHTADGSKTIRVSVTVSEYWGSKPTWVGSGGTVEQNITLTPIPRASSVAVSDGIIGAPLQIQVIKANAAFVHTLRCEFGAASETVAERVGDAAILWTPPMELCGEIPHARGGSCTITCETYNGSTLVGTQTAVVTLTVPDSVCLSVRDGWARAVPEHTEPAAAGMEAFVQGYSAAKVVFAEACIDTDHAYGAGIASYCIAYNGKSCEAPYITDVLQTAGEAVITATVVDTRGIAVSEDLVISVEAYGKPFLSDVRIFRCSSGGTETDEGTFLSVTATANISRIAGLNTSEMRLTVGKLLQAEIPDGETVVIGDGLVLATVTYRAELKLTDRLGNESVYTQIIPTAEVLFHGRKGGKGAAFGKYAEADDLLEVDWSIRGYRNLQIDGDASIDGTLTVGDLNIEGALTVGDAEGLVNSLDITPERIGAVPSTRKVNGKELSSDVEDTDYVVAQGTSGIWTYRKWNSGIGECWGFTSDKTVALTKAWGSVYVNADSTPIGNATAYPFVFASNPVVSASPKQSSYNWWLYISSAGNTTTSPSYQAARGASGSITGGVYLYVIGRWK